MVLLENKLKFGFSIEEQRGGKNAPALQIMNSRCKTNADNENGIFKNKHNLVLLRIEQRKGLRSLSLSHTQPQEELMHRRNTFCRERAVREKLEKRNKEAGTSFYFHKR